MDNLKDTLQHYWGYDSFRPHQSDAMQCILRHQDSVVVLPTGGGKSLCYQAPAVTMDGMAVVVSPLIALMKDQVDALTQNGIPAACINSSLLMHEKREIADGVRNGRYKLLYVAPERLVQERFLRFLKPANVSFFAIDEAHCISMWGHDFRPEYRELAHLKEYFPGTSVHAYTATATPQVREDIVTQLGLSAPEVHVGSFVRPNLFYRVQQRNDLLTQTLEVIRKHEGQSGIVYCIRRKDVEGLCADLNANGVRALPYHAGMNDQARRENQEAFVRDEAEVIVATVAFGMGIDKPDVRFVVHGGMPKSLEHYQQESGRAGRDGLEADCFLFYSGGDFGLWKSIMNGEESNGEAAAYQLSAMYAFCTGMNCRHRSLVEYFGQALEVKCESCDVCRGEIEGITNADDVARKILEGVRDTGQRFGAMHVANVLAGSREARIREYRHDQLDCHGVLGTYDRKVIRGMVDQLTSQGFLVRTGDYNVLSLTRSGNAVLSGESDESLRLVASAEKTSGSRRAATDQGWEGVDRALFQTLRELRRELADDRSIPPYMVFGDASLRDMARTRPGSVETIHRVRGVGDRKAEEYGAVFVAAIRNHCEQNNLSTDDAEAVIAPATPRVKRVNQSEARANAMKLFAKGHSIEEVSERTERKPSTVVGYLNDYLEEEGVTDPTPWVEPFLMEKIEKAASEVGVGPLKPVFEYFEGEIPYDVLRLAMTCLKNRENS